MLDFARFTALSFDCYGTLIDWEAGILEALRPALDRRGIDAPDDRLLELFAAAESGFQRQAWLPYKDVLRRVMEQIARGLGFEPTAEEAGSLADSVGRWEPFPDTIEALGRLKERYRLAIVSNIDDDLFSRTARRLRVPFDLVTTAEQVHSYKPAPAHFTRTLERLAVSRDALLHVAQSLFHDIAPAGALGLATVWVNRRRGREGPGATPPAEARPDLEVKDLAALVDLIAPGPPGGPAGGGRA